MRVKDRIHKLVQESGYMESHRKPDVLGLFDEIQSQGQDFLYLIKIVRENSDNDRFIMGKIEALIIECVKSGDIEKFLTEMEELRRTVEVEY
jgi:hypothetical protein